MQRIIVYGVTLVALLMALLGLGFTIGSVGFVPDHAIVYIDAKAMVYYSPINLTAEKAASLGLKKSTFGQAKKQNYQMNEEDKQKGYFQQEGRRVSGMLLERFGLLPELDDRVDSKGNWRY